MTDAWRSTVWNCSAHGVFSAFLLNRPQLLDRSARSYRFGGAEDCGRVDPIVPVELGDSTGLTEVLYAESAGPVAVDGPEPGERCRMTVHDGDECAVVRYAF